ncbi:MAG TPA: hypothetical protein PKK06_08930 [Phycisphaerae bacterium]|nr:hypothetical protein [Phycisphaerae bacterium]HNU45306.1 hypothetical protein [Phycisphaerae bacterium]
MNGAVKPKRAVGAVLLVCLLMPGVVRAAEPGEEESSPRAPNYLSLNQLDAYLELKAEFDQTRVRSDYGAYRWERRQTNRDWGFEERLGFTLDGAVIDPSVISFCGDLGLALTQDRFKERTEGYSWTQSDEGHLTTFDLRANFFAGKEFSGTVYGTRQEDRINRRFQPTLHQRRTEAGTSWVWANDTVPMELSYNYRETERTGNRRALDDEHYTQHLFNYNADWRIDQHHHVKFSYEHAEDEREFQGLRQYFDTTRDLLRVDHELLFGDQQQHRWETLMRWQEESGDFARDIFEIGPQLTLQHTDSLKTLYKYQFNREQYEGLDVDLHRGDFQVIHQLYKNLTTTVDLFGLHEKVESDTHTTQYGGSVDWQYNRKNPLGTFYANLALGYDIEEVYGDDGERLVRNESHTFRDPLAIILRNRNIVPGSIVVSDTSDRRFFTGGLDYLLVPQGDVIQIVRIPTGRLADGDTILVDYKYRTPKDGQIDTARADFSLEQRFNCGLTPYYRFAFRDQDVDYSTGFARSADRTDHHRLGARYDRKRFMLGAEYEIFDDTVDPYDAYHLNGTWHVLDGAEHAVDASTRLSRFYFEDGPADRNVTLVDLDVSHRCQLGRGFSTLGRLGYRWQDDELDGYTRGWDATAGLSYEWGLLSAELTLEYDRLSLPASVEDDFGAYLRVRRDIPNLLRVR